MFSGSEKIDQYFAVLTTCGAVGVCEFKQSNHKTKNVIVSKTDLTPLRSMLSRTKSTEH